MKLGIVTVAFITLIVQKYNVVSTLTENIEIHLNDVREDSLHPGNEHNEVSSSLINPGNGQSKSTITNKIGNEPYIDGKHSTGKSNVHPHLPRNEIPRHSDNEHDSSESDNGYDYEEYDDDGGWGESFNKNDTDEISEIERKEEEDEGPYGTLVSGRKPKISKCCNIDEGLNSHGQCRLLKEHEIHSENSWFPDKVIDFTINNFTEPNISEWDISYSKKIKCPPNESAEVISDTNHFAIVTNGKLFLLQHSKDIGPSDYCIDISIGKGRAVLSCFSKEELCGEGVKCLRKCCPEGAMVEEPSGNCVIDKQTHRNKFPVNEYKVIHGSPTCNIGQYLTPITDTFYISDDNSLVTATGPNASFMSYCLDFFMEANPSKSEEDISKHRHSRKDKTDYYYRQGKSNEQFANNAFEDFIVKPTTKNLPVLKAAICFQHEEELKKGESAGMGNPSYFVNLIYGIAFILSAICIALSALITLRLPELRSLHGKCQLSHLGTLFCLFTLLAIVHLGSEKLTLYHGMCTFLAVSLHTCALSAFLWLNLLCVNIYLTFRSLRPPLSARRNESKRLICLCIYAWGIPLAFCLFLFVLDQSPERLGPMPRPEYGNATCLISKSDARFAYLFGPIGLLLLANGILFCLTAQELLCGLWRLDNSDSINFRRKSMGIVVAKLGIVMGMGWIFDILTWSVGNKFMYLQYAADIFNALQGVFIFIVLIWRKRVLEVIGLRKSSVFKDDTLTNRPFIPKTPTNNGNLTNGDTSLVIVPDS